MKGDLKERPRGHEWTEEQNAFIREHYLGRQTEELRLMLNMKFGLNLSFGQVRSRKKYLKLSSGEDTRFQKGATGYWLGKKKREYTKEEIAYIRENAHVPTYLLTEQFNNRFGLNKTERQILGIKYRYKITGSPAGGGSMRFKTGFKQGHMPPLWAPVGTERCVNSHGLIEIKVRDAKDGRGTNNYEFKHRHIWEAANGPIPKGHMIIFADGNSQNCELSNLLCITKAQNGVINSRIKRGKNPEATKVAVHLADALMQIESAEKKLKKR